MVDKRILFRPPQGGWHCPGRVLLNWSREPLVDLDHIAESYRSVAEERIATLKASRGALRAGDEFEAYPIVFLYRHALELRLKAIVFAGAVLLHEQGEVPMPVQQLTKHDLPPLVREISRIFEAMVPGGSHWDLGLPELRTLSDFKNLVRELDHYDKASFAFRYSVGKDGETASLPKNFEFDLFAFSALMDHVVRNLAGAPDWIRESMQERWAAAYEAQQEAWANADFDAPEFDPPDYDPSDYELPECDPE